MKLFYFHPENPEGNLEYKLLLKVTDEERLEKLATQLNYRLNEGDGEAIYEIGVTDDGNPIGITKEQTKKSLEILENIAQRVQAEISVIRTSPAEHGYITEVLIRRRPMTELPINVTVALAGNVDAGKSTLLGTLISGELDDGQGYTREFVFNHLHESISGRTSSIAFKTLGFDGKGSIVNHSEGFRAKKDPIYLLQNSAKLIHFVDLAGHQKYLKTTIFGITGQYPDYVAVVIGVNTGIQKMTKEHIGLAEVLKIPMFFVITKIDLAPYRLKPVLEDLTKLLKSPGLSKIPFVIKTFDDVVVAARRVSSRRIAPIFIVSNVTGEGLEFLYTFLNLIPRRVNWKKRAQDHFRLYISNIYPNVPGAGLVVGGTVISGTLSANSTIKIGPLDDGKYLDVKAKSIQYRRVPVRSCSAGQFVTIALGLPPKYKKFKPRKGQILTSEQNPKAYREFIADVIVLHHPTTIKPGYHAYIHCKTIRQQAVMLFDKGKYLRTGDQATCHFKFLFRPESIQVGDRFVFREGLTKGLGIVKKVLK